MLFMVMHKMTADLEEAPPPTQQLIDDMGSLIGELVQRGAMRSGEGLKPTRERIRIRHENGHATAGPCPKSGVHELLAGFVLLRVRSMEVATSWGKQLSDALGGADVDVGPVVEPWDLGMMPRPAKPPLRVLLTHKASDAFEAGRPRSPEIGAKLAALFEDMKANDAFVASEVLRPSSRGARLRRASGKVTWTDGPFTESKELISGFVILDAESLAEVQAFTERYAAILGDIEVDVREVA